jgi:hypothetical protein
MIRVSDLYPYLYTNPEVAFPKKFYTKQNNFKSSSIFVNILNFFEASDKVVSVLLRREKNCENNNFLAYFFQILNAAAGPA